MGAPVGRGTPSFRFDAVEVTVRRFADPGDVIEAFEDDLSTTVALVASGGTTFLSPILGRLGAIVALDGTLRSHLAIVSREFDVPCLVGASLDGELVDGALVRIEIAADGGGTITALATSDADMKEAAL